MKAGSRYAKALLDLAVEQNSLEKVYADMHLIQQVCASNGDLVSLFRSPIIKTDKKQKIMKEIFGDKVSKLTSMFLNLLAEKRRESYIASIAEEFVDQYKQKKNILTAVITTASGLDADLKSRVLEIVKGSANSEVELIEKVDEKLIGGYTLQVGDKRIDASLSKQIHKLAMSFNENPYIKDY